MKKCINQEILTYFKSNNRHIRPITRISHHSNQKVYSHPCLQKTNTTTQYHPLCLGRHRRFNGYITRKVAAQARQPVLVVGQPPPERPGISWWKRCLVVTGDSPGAEAATAYALALAQEEALDVCLLHRERNTPIFAAPTAATRAHNSLMLAAAWATATGVNYEVQHASGDVVTAIIETATRAHCDAIILGIYRCTGWKRLFYDRTATRVTAHSPLPVLLVNPRCWSSVGFIEQA